jgi:hypothetical protein
MCKPKREASEEYLGLGVPAFTIVRKYTYGV